jgi:hypothetical protein
MNKLFSLLLISSIFAAGDYGYNGSTTAGITAIGGIIKAQHVNVEKKYKRKDCPVCKGKGFYISGDGISKVDCGYCEAEKTSAPKLQEVKPIPSVLKSSTTTIQSNCPNGNCPSPKQYIIRR